MRVISANNFLRALLASSRSETGCSDLLALTGALGIGKGHLQNGKLTMKSRHSGERDVLFRMLLPCAHLSIAEVFRREGGLRMSLPNRRKQLNPESHAVSETSR
jgi:hypothetical protein